MRFAIYLIYEAEFFTKHKTKGVLNHGETIDCLMFKKVNASRYLKVVLEAEKIACVNNKRLCIPCNGYWQNYIQC